MLRFRNMGSFVPKVAQQANADHREILEAIKKSDFGAMENTIRSHFAWTKEDIIRKIKLARHPEPQAGSGSGRRHGGWRN